MANAGYATWIGPDRNIPKTGKRSFDPGFGDRTVAAINVFGQNVATAESAILGNANGNAVPSWFPTEVQRDD
jgi:hypothetical protein